MDFDIIKKIKSPADIKAMTMDELRQAASQMRDAVLYRTSLFSGHVGPNLGDIEAVIAMHYVFDAPEDRLVLDVSHQDFPHKMITGRVDGFINPDDFAKVGEYTDPKESPEYDLFYAGHTSPSISLCAGLARARDLKGEKYNVVAFIGDGSLSGGEAFEGLNVAGAMKSNLIIIVNDNQMAIAENHGGIYDNLRELRETNGTASDNLFRAFGLDYVYVAEGNNLEKVIEAYRKVKDSDHPVVVHLNTQKGEGYAPAERDRERFHWSVPFDLATGDPKVFANGPDYSDILCDFIMEKHRTEPKLLVVSSATPDSFGLDAAKRAALGDHFLDTNIAEQTAVAVMAGAARNGAKAIYPVVSTFLQRAYDQLMEDWAMDNSPALMVADSTGVRGIPDLTHLGFWDIPMITSIPEIVYLAPTNAEEFRAMLEWGFTQNEHKVAVRVPTYSFEHADTPVDTDYSDLNRFKVVKEGKDVAVIAAGDFMAKGKEVVGLLAEKGIDATLINPRFVSGVDMALIKGLSANHRLVVTLEDGSVEGGFGQRVASAVGPTGMRCLNFGLAKKFEDRYEVDVLEKANNLEPAQIAAAIINTIE